MSKFGKSTTLFEVIPAKGFIEKIKFWLLKRELESTAKEYGLTLDSEFYNELARWTGKKVAIVFSRKDNEPGRWKVETINEHFDRMLKNSEECGVAHALL